MRRLPMRGTGVPLGLAIGVLAGCATLQQYAALRQVDFSIDRVSEVRLAGVDVSRVRAFSDLSLTDVAALSAALSRRNVPLQFNLHLRAVNPADNRVTARLVRLEWTALLEERETVSGVLDREYAFPPGSPQDVAVGISLNAVEFFQNNARDLVELALNLSGRGGAPKNVKLRAVPTINTALGPVRYPGPITILSAEVGR